MKKFAITMLISLTTLMLCGQNMSVTSFFNGSVSQPTDFEIREWGYPAMDINYATVVMPKTDVTDARICLSFKDPIRATYSEVFVTPDSTTSTHENYCSFLNSDMTRFILKHHSAAYLSTNAGDALMEHIMVSFEYGYIDSLRIRYEYTGTSSFDQGYASYDTIPVWNNGKIFGINSVNTDSIYDKGFSDGAESIDTIAPWYNGFATGVVSVDTVSVWNNGYATGFISVDTVALWNNGYASGVASVDTATIYNNGVNSVNTETYWYAGFYEGVASVDSSIIREEGFNAGVASVDTVAIFNNGVESVDTEEFWNLGFLDGVTSVDTLVIFNNGVASVDTVIPWNNGYQTGYTVGLEDCQSTGKSSLETLDETIVYPNPTTDWITIKVDNLEKAEVYDINGILLDTEYNNTISLGVYNAGTYFLRIYSTKGELGIVKVLRN